MRRPIAAPALVATAALAASAHAQELVPNPSFEQYTLCPTGPGQIANTPPWIAPTLGSSDYFNACNTTPDSTGVPTNAVGMQSAFSGSAYAGIIVLANPMALPNYREYLQTSLLAPGLDAQKTYRFTMHWSLAEDSSAATDRLGAYFSVTAPSGTTWDPLPLTPQVETPLGTFLTDTTSWNAFSQTFVAAGGEQYLTLGNFHDFASSGTTPAGSGPAPPLQLGTAYYYVDVVSVQCEPCTALPPDATAWWPLDEPAGPTAFDVVGAQHGVHTDGPVPLGGWVDGGLDFFASAVEVASTPALSFGISDFTIDAWVRPGLLGTDQALFTKIGAVGPPTGPGWAVVLNADGTVSFAMVDAALAEVTATSAGALSTEEWSHVTVVVDRDDPAGGRIHVDDTVATFDPTTAAGDLSNGLPLWFARDGGSGAGADLIGTLDEVEVFHRALTVAEVQALLEARTSGKCKTFLEIEPVTPVIVTTTGTIGTAGTLTNSGGTTGTFTVAVKGDPPGTKCGVFTSSVAGPVSPRVLTPQPIQVAAGASVPVAFDLDVPRGLNAGERACWSVTTTHVETGRTWLARGVLRGYRTPRTQPAPPSPPARDLGGGR